MAVIIDIPIPDKCSNCPFCIYSADEKRCIGYCNTSDEDYYCKALDRFMEYDEVDGGVDILGKPSDCPLVEATPKADYEARLKSDIVAMLEDLKKEMNLIKECEHQIYGKEEWNFVGKCQDVIQQKIDALEEKDNGLNEKTSD